MNIKHFIKTLLIFSGMIAIGLLGVFLLSHFDKSGESVKLPSIGGVAK
jgi:hypothetical protein